MAVTFLSSKLIFPSSFTGMTPIKELVTKHS